jgi:probable HAF family extracellular repeat protein
VGVATAQTYTATDLGILGGGATPAGINTSGQVTGTFETASIVPHAFLATNGAIADLGTLSSSSPAYSIGYALNKAGQVVGQSEVNVNGGTSFHAFLYSDGSLIDLDTVDFESSANGINSSGQIAGYAAASSGGAYYAAMFTGGHSINLGTIPGGGSCEAQGINDNGQLIGFCDVDGGNNTHAFLYNQGKMIDLGTLAGSSTTFVSWAYAINNRGQVVGYSETASGATHAFLYSGGSMTDLGVIAGQTGSVAYAVNNLGQVVGSSGSHAFLYTGGAMTDLNSVVTLPSGVTLFSAAGINDSGQITAEGSNDHAYLLTPATSQLTVLNPFAPYAVIPQAPPTLNIETMLSTATPAHMLAADGESALLLVYQSASSQPVTFTLSAPGTTIPSGASPGSLGPFQPNFLGSPQPTSGVLSFEVTSPNFGPDVDAMYTFLALLWAPSAMPVANTIPAVQLLATATQPGHITGQANINLEPPPLLLVHGIWSSPGSTGFTPGGGGFYDYIASLYPHNFIFPVDYSAIDSLSFADPKVQTIFASYLEDALAAAAASGMAARNADVVGHSTGGLVSRSFVSNPIAEANLLNNPVHNLITVGAPHEGTALATTLENNASVTTASPAGEVAAWCLFTSPCSLSGVMSAIGRPLSAGAMAIEPGSAALLALSSKNVFSAMAGAAPSSISTTESLLDIAIGAFIPSQTVSSILGSTNDTIVTTASQDPPGAANSASPVSGVVSSSLCGSCNVAEMADPGVWAQAYYWLTGGTGTDPSRPASVGIEPRGARPETSAGPAPVLNLGGYTQVAASNVTFQPGSGSALTIGTANAITATSTTKTISEVLLLQTVSDPSDIPFLYVTQSPFSIPFTPTRLGPVNFGAITVFSDNTYALTPLTYTLQTSGTPYALTVLNAPVASMTPGSSRAVSVQALFAGGPVNVTLAASYSTASGSMNVFSIGAGATITANSPGLDWLNVSYGGLTTTAPIAVGTCTYSMSPMNQIVPYTGGTVSIAVTTQPGCLWTATGGASWLTFSLASGTGNETIALTAAANSSGVPEGALVTLEGVSAIVTQPTAACGYGLSQNQINAAATGATGSITATTTSTCPVIASSNQPWVTATPVGTAVEYTVLPNSTPSARNATLTIGTTNVGVSQLGFSCAVSGNGDVTVTDIQQMVNEALGNSAAGNDQNGDQVVNVVDLQIVINAAMALGCVG